MPFIVHHERAPDATKGKMISVSASLGTNVTVGGSYVDRARVPEVFFFFFWRQMIVRYGMGAACRESTPASEMQWCGKNGNLAP